VEDDISARDQCQNANGVKKAIYTLHGSELIGELSSGDELLEMTLVSIWGIDVQGRKEQL